MRNKLTKKQLQALETKKKLQEVALKLFKEHGFDYVTIKDIVGELGLTTTAFHHHYKSKEEILFNYNADYYMSLTKNLVLNNALNSVDKCKVILSHFMTINAENSLDFMRVVIRLTTYEKMYAPQHLEYFEYFRDVIGHHIDKAKSEKLIVDNISTDVIVEQLMTIFLGISTMWVARNGEFDLKEKGMNLITLYLNSVMKLN